eukprot:1393560-Amorphochlora_amoeboformis.AAC.1
MRDVAPCHTEKNGTPLGSGPPQPVFCQSSSTLDAFSGVLLIRLCIIHLRCPSSRFAAFAPLTGKVSRHRRTQCFVGRKDARGLTAPSTSVLLRRLQREQGQYNLAIDVERCMEYNQQVRFL